MVGERAYSELIRHPVEEIDTFLDDFDLKKEWVGVVGGPQQDDGDVVLVYDVRTLDGPYEGKVGRTWTYRLTGNQAVDAPEIYQEQVEAIKAAFPDATVQCYKPSS